MTKSNNQKAIEVTTSSCFSVLKIAVPSSTAWDPHIAEQMMVGLFSILRPFKLEIGATAGKLEWAIVVPQEFEDSTVSFIYSLYPNADIVAKPKVNTAIGYRLYNLHTAAPFFAPLKHASDFTHLDPLAAILKAMNQARQDEQLIYELELMSAREEQYKIGEKFLTQSTIKWWHFLSLEGAAFAAASKSMGVDKVNKYVPEIQRMAQSKLNASLKEVTFSIKVKADTVERAHSLIGLFDPGLASFERDGFNFFVPPQEKSFPLVLSAAEVAALWHLPTEQCQLPDIVWSASAQAPYLAHDDAQKPSVKLGVNRYQGRTQDVHLTYADRQIHVNMFGRPGSGKTNLMHHIIHQDIANGHGVGVIDPHGDLIEEIMACSIPSEREKDVILFDVNDDDFPIGLNLLVATDGVDHADITSRAVGVIRKIFENQWSMARMEDAIYAALSTLIGVGGYTIMDVPRLLLDSDLRHKVVAQLRDPVALDFWRTEFETMGSKLRYEVARPISTRLRRFYRNHTMRRIMGQESCLDFRQIMDEGKIFLANISGLGEIETETLGALLMSRFEIAALSRGSMPPVKRRPYYLHIDEVQNFITTSLPVIFSEARKFGLSMTVANQFTSQLAGDTLDAIFGTSGTTMIFGVGPKDAPVLAPYVRPQFTSNDLLALDKFNVVVKMQSDGRTMPAFNMATLAPLPKKIEGSQERTARIRQMSQQAYGRPSEEVDAEILARFEMPESDDEEDSEDNTYLG